MKRVVVESPFAGNVVMCERGSCYGAWMDNEKPIRVNVHGLRNTVGFFDGGNVDMFVGAMEKASHVGEASVHLTVTGSDPSGKTIDVEIAVPHSQVSRLIELIQDRARISS